jgi:hypothetical protein
MANEMPDVNRFTGLTRKVMEYSECFAELVAKLKTPGFSEADWRPIETLVDVAHFERVGVFLTQQVETIDWATYKKYIGQYGAATRWEGTLRRITEGPGVVVQELEERNTRDGITDIANTVMIYAFNSEGKLGHLDVYVNPMGKRPSA